MCKFVNINELNNWIKVGDCQIPDKTIYYLQEIHFKYQNTDILKCKRWKKKQNVKHTNQKTESQSLY